MNEACEAHTRDMAGGTEDAFEVPDSFCTGLLSDKYKDYRCHDLRLRIDLIEKAAAILLGEDACKPPGLLL